MFNNVFSSDLSVGAGSAGVAAKGSSQFLMNPPKRLYCAENADYFMGGPLSFYFACDIVPRGLGSSLHRLYTWTILSVHVTSI